MGIEIKEKSNVTEKKVVGTQISQSMYDRLKAEADSDFMSISDLLRKIIFLYYRDKDVNYLNPQDEKETK